MYVAGLGSDLKPRRLACCMFPPICLSPARSPVGRASTSLCGRYHLIRTAVFRRRPGTLARPALPSARMSAHPPSPLSADHLVHVCIDTPLFMGDAWMPFDPDMIWVSPRTRASIAGARGLYQHSLPQGDCEATADDAAHFPEPLVGTDAVVGVPGEEVAPNAAAAHQVIEDFRPLRLDIALGWAA